MATRAPARRTTTPRRPAAKPTPTEPETVPVLDDVPVGDPPPFYVVGDTFYAVTSDGLLEVPLRFKTRLFREVMASDGDNLELFLILVDGIGDEEVAAQLDELDVYESVRIAGTYFRAWREKQDASVGEARRSSS